jgi:hypothetical protein
MCFSMVFVVFTLTRSAPPPGSWLPHNHPPFPFLHIWSVAYIVIYCHLTLVIIVRPTNQPLAASHPCRWYNPSCRLPLFLAGDLCTGPFFLLCPLIQRYTTLRRIWGKNYEWDGNSTFGNWKSETDSMSSKMATNTDCCRVSAMVGLIHGAEGLVYVTGNVEMLSSPPLSFCSGRLLPLPPPSAVSPAMHGAPPPWLGPTVSITARALEPSYRHPHWLAGLLPLPPPQVTNFLWQDKDTKDN